MKHLHYVCLLLLSYTGLLLCAVRPVRADVRREAEALVKWKASLAGADESLGSWSLANSTSLCRWAHISCNSAGHIIRLNLTIVILNGTLDRFDFSAFPYMEDLILSQNGLYGIIPPGIGNMTSLIQLGITLNPHLRGAIPRSIGQLMHLVVLEMSVLGLDGTLPEEISNLTSLEELHLDSVTLTGSIPPTIGMLTKLHALSLSVNNLTGSIPLEIGNMTELQELDFSVNYLEGPLPGTISHLIKLQGLLLSENQLGGHIFPELGNSSLLDMVEIQRNNFSGVFPSSICVGGALRTVSAGHNGFTGINHQTFQNCTTLRYVDFTANNIVAELRACFGEHPLTTMALGQNQLYGTLVTDQGKDFFCNYTQLSFLDLSSNALRGGLSQCFWDMANLVFMDLSSNYFSGVVAFSRTCGDYLSYLHLANNNFIGTFPLGLKKCKELITLDLGGNNFSGTIPSWISKSLPGLKFLRLSSNTFEGVIPHQILQFRQLQLLDLSENKLTGPIPDDFTNFTGMTHEQENVDYVDTGYYGHAQQIQIVWKNVDYLYIMVMAGIAGIDFSGNSLSQEIPNGLTTLIGIRYLNLSRNHLSGLIPNGIGNLVLVESLDLSQNQLSGEIPPSFAALKALSVLNLSTNKLSGTIPTGSQLQTLDDPSIYNNNPGLCGFPLKGCVNSSTPTQTETSMDEDREALWLYCFVAAGFISGFWLYLGFLFRSETWRYSFYQYVDNMQAKVTKKIRSCISCFQVKGPE
nr:probable leucine-rich repeat receptor-like protein kinase At1g35710 [Aegilops tauschii subsp. strangulata]